MLKDLSAKPCTPAPLIPSLCVLGETETLSENALLTTVGQVGISYSDRTDNLVSEDFGEADTFVYSVILVF